MSLKAAGCDTVVVGTVYRATDVEFCLSRSPLVEQLVCVS